MFDSVLDIIIRVMNPELKGLVISVFEILPACAFGNLANLTSFLFHFFGPGTYMMLDLGLMFEYYSFNHTASFELRKDKFTWQCLATVTIAKSWYHPKIQSMLSIIHLFKCQELIFSLLLRTQICKNIRYTFSSNHNIHKSSCGLCFWASDPLINRF